MVTQERERGGQERERGGGGEGEGGAAGPARVRRTPSGGAASCIRVGFGRAGLIRAH
jgi:hypothetical protein